MALQLIHEPLTILVRFLDPIHRRAEVHGQGINGCKASLCLYIRQHEHGTNEHTHIPASSGIPTHDLSV
jgi:hypothetical protein